ncbi:MAG: InlB B-repeat-containing protein [Oscillospiraceae bacterium]|nr:InlB B-repeat-containing protein [Oscillospiraceae bacterium]
MKKLSKVLAVLLAMLMMFGIIPMTASAADTYTVKYNPNGGSGSMTNSTFTFDTEVELRANRFTRLGYTFLGWSKDRLATTATYTDQQSVTNVAEAGATTVTLYAIWAPNTFTVQFNANGGEGTMANQVFTYDVGQALTANTFTREGYTFEGWAKTASARFTDYTDQQSVKNLTTTNQGTVVLYAVWKRIPATMVELFIATEPTKTEYYVGDTFDATGLVVKVNMSDHTVRDVTNYTLSTPDMSTVGEKTVTVTCEELTASFTINVVERPVYNYTFNINAPEVTEIAHGESVVLSTKVEGTYPDGMYVVWTANNQNFATTANADGTYTVVAEGVGATTFTATLYTAENEAVAQETVELTALEEVEEPGFFAKIINFFKGIIAAILGIFKK